MASMPSVTWFSRGIAHRLHNIVVDFAHDQFGGTGGIEHGSARLGKEF